MSNKCLQCNSYIDYDVFNYSVNHWGIPLCITHQHWLKQLPDHVTDDALDLYFALKQRGVPAELEKFDGHKTIDIAVVEAKVNIEIDGSQHNWDPHQALADLQRTYYSFKKGYFTLRIPNTLVRNNLDAAADMITQMLELSREKFVSKYKYSYSRSKYK